MVRTAPQFVFAATAWIVFHLSSMAIAPAQTNAAGEDEQALQQNLADAQSRMAQRYDRLELLAGRLAELSRSTQPRRARLLRQVIAKGREGDVAGRFDRIVAALEQVNLASATEDQRQLLAELNGLLQVLLQEDRDRQIESQQKRIAKYLADVKKLIRLQRGVKGRTDGGEQSEQLAQDQGRVSDSTGKLRDKIEATEGSGQESSDSDGNASGEGEPSEGKSSDGQPSNGEPGEGEPSDGESGGQAEPSSGGQQGGSPGGGEQDSQSSPESESKSSEQRAMEQLDQARRRMQQAEERLREAQRNEALDEQEQAIRALEQAKAELERILRQLREEELQRTLVLLEARFRKMLAAQIEVYEETLQLAGAQNVQPHELEIAGGRLSRKELQIVDLADRALILLREDGTSVAFPEAVEQAREDMLQTARRLREVKLGQITQGLEQDIIAALEEVLAALQQALKEMRQQQAQQQQATGQPGEQSLVDQLAELRMIRALQQRVNLRTKRYGELIEGEQALAADLLEALDQLAVRQQRIFRATRDLNSGANQ